MSDTVLIRGGCIVTVDPKLGVLDRGDILVRDGVIAEIAGQIAAPEGAQIVEASGRIIAPGFVDTHRHTWQAALRMIAPDATFGEYFQLVVGGHGLYFDAPDVEIATLVGALDAVDSGITTLLDWAHIMNTPEHADADIAGLKASGIRAVLAYGYPSTSVEAWNFDSVLDHPEDARRVKAEYFGSDDQLLTFAMALRGPDFSTVDVVKHDWALARDLDAAVTVHAGVAAYGAKRSPIEVLDELGLLAPRTTIVHGNALSDAELARLRDTGGTISSAPAIEMIMGHGHPAIDNALRNGLRPSLSTDVVTGIASDMFTQMRAAFYAGRLSHYADDAARDSSPVSVQDVLEFATIEGARAVGLDGVTGSLTPGKRADLVIYDATGPGMAPLNDPVGAIVLSADKNSIVDVMVDGAFLKRDGALLGHDLKALADRISLSRDGIVKRGLAAGSL